ncbi:MAG: low molecular weight phosphatase family protein, partial [Pseudomonadota bacterium]
ELGINMRNHHCKSFEQLYDISFDIVIAMSEAAYSRAKELTRMMASTVEYWALDDPSMIEGSYQERLQAYRVVRDRLEAQLQDRFGIFRIE